ncbi:MAG: MBL fold metallo-hydrolase [Isosphaeraceae bacterium]
MADVRLLPLGVGDAFTDRFHTTCLALNAGEDWLLIDCPHPIRKVLREGSIAAGLSPTLDLDRVSGLALTHLHADHVSGIEGYLFYSHYVLGKRPRVLAHPEVSARLAEGVLGGSLRGVRVEPKGPEHDLSLSDYVEITPLSYDRAVSFGPFAIECRRTLHSVPTTAFRITAMGRVLGFSADTAFDPGLIDWLSSSDLIVHEVTTLPRSNVHTPYEKLVQLPAPLRSKMRLTHYPDDFDHDASAIATLRQGRWEPV